MTAMATDQTSKGQAPGIESGPFDVSRRRVLPMLPLLVLGGLAATFLWGVPLGAADPFAEK
jgi:hypothetical protein